MHLPETHFASPERAPIETVRRQVRLWEALPSAGRLLNAAAGWLLVLNAQRQVVFASDGVVELLADPLRRELVGARVGELLGCEHASDCAGGCGTSEHCAECGAVLAMLEALSGRGAIRECRMMRRVGSHPEALDLLVRASPFALEGQWYCLVALADISHEKRRRVLERTFFHDLVNMAGGLQGLLEALIREAPASLKPDLELARRGFEDLLDQIQVQRELAGAENGELEVHPLPLNSRVLLMTLHGLYANHPLAIGRRLEVAPSSVPIEFVSDRTLLLRILGNLVKNALEACPEGGAVSLECRDDAGAVRFAVHNPGAMPRSVQLELFKRSFSTKGAGRGLGTYSARLLTEKYLGGTIGFSSDLENGTLFWVRLDDAD